MKDSLVSVVIPVYNAEKLVEKTVKNILRQNYDEIEIILVENGSRDRSWGICRALEKSNHRVRAFHNEEKGTSLARRRGVEEAHGKYILFSDQDDTYANNHCIRDMVRAIQEDNSQICQFSHYNQYLPYIRRKRSGRREKRIYTRGELMQGYIAGVLGQPDGIFDTTVWSKIYDAEVLKDAVCHINTPLLFAEDMYLNILAFFSEKTKRVSVRSDAYYVWNAGIGFSSTSQSGKVLFREYQYVKDLTVTMGQKYGLPEQLIQKCHLETLYFHKNLVMQIIEDGLSKEQVLKEIKRLNEYPYLEMAKKSVARLPQEEMWDELYFMTGEYTEDEYYAWCIRNRPKESKVKKLWRKLMRLRK